MSVNRVTTLLSRISLIMEGVIVNYENTLTFFFRYLAGLLEVVCLSVRAFFEEVHRDLGIGGLGVQTIRLHANIHVAVDRLFNGHKGLNWRNHRSKRSPVYCRVAYSVSASSHIKFANVGLDQHCVQIFGPKSNIARLTSMFIE